jgi:hypothetical protein
MSVAPRRHWLLPSLPILVGIGSLVRVLAVRRELLNDPDTYLHIAAGRWILAHWALPVHDVFSHSMPGAVWVPHEWLAEIVLALTYDGLGWSGVVTLTALCFALAVVLFTRRLLDHFEPITGLLVAISGAMLVLPHLLARAHVLALPLLVIWCGGLFAAADQRRSPSWLLLPVLALWANLHGSFMFGLALAVFLAGEAVLLAPATERLITARRWGLFLAGAVLASILSPNGIDSLLTPFRIMNLHVMQSVFIEWQPPNFSQPQLVEFWLLLALFAGFTSGVKLPILRVLIMLGIVHMAISHVRHADLLGLVVPLALAGSLGPQLRRLVVSDKPSSLARFMAQLALPSGWPARVLSGGLAVAIALLSVAMPLHRPDGPITPATALSAARDRHLTGPVFNDEGFGGYLLFEGVPSFIDGRMEMYGDTFLQLYLDARAGKQPALDKVLSTYHIAWTLLPPDSPAVPALDHMVGWQRVYQDKFAVIHQRDPSS